MPPGRNKFLPIENRLEMPPSIPAWEVALRKVDWTRHPRHNPRKQDGHYILPEPALFVSPEYQPVRQLRLHHFSMLRDALLYRIAHAPSHSLLLNPQEWRDVLSGKVEQQGRRNTKARERTGMIERLLAPALQACGITEHHDFPLDMRLVPEITHNRAKEIIWEVGETNFRFELVSLDRRASGLDRLEECKDCFPGRMLMGMPIEMSTRGLGSVFLSDRHSIYVWLAKLMCAWGGEVPIVIQEAADEKEWTVHMMRELEEEVAGFYCQQFYDYYGRAAVIPMRIEHEFGQ